ncbi:MAG: prephenate dehydratase [Acidobacteriota bacterium]
MEDHANLVLLRNQVDELDRKLLFLLRERLELVANIARQKRESLSSLRDPEREKAVLARVEALAGEAGLDPGLCRELFRVVLAMSVRVQEQALLGVHPHWARNAHRCCYQGSPYAYSHLAAQRFFGSKSRHMDFLGMPTFAACVSAVETGEAGWAVLPIENTTAGSINETYDLLRHAAVSIVGEEVLPVEHCLLGLPGASLTGIRVVLSHPQALAQCRGFLASLPNVQVQAFVDTAEAAREVAYRQDPAVAAVASAEAGEAYGLQVLARAIADQQENWTRFVVVAANPLVPDPTLPAKTSLIFTTPHREGALAHCLAILAEHGLNLTKLESRPLPSRPWEYMFYVDFMGSLAEERVTLALGELESFCPFLKVLGSYPARTLAPGSESGS